MAGSVSGPNASEIAWRWPQFVTCQPAFVAIILAASGATRLYEGVQQRQAVAAIEAVYGRIMYDYHRNEAGDFDTHRASPLPAWLIHVAGQDLFHDAVWVDLDSERVTDADLDRLTRLRRLTCIHLSNTSITNQGLSSLARLPKLKYLTINTAGIGDVALSHIATASSLERLEIHGAAVSDQGIQELAKLRNLKYLWLESSDVTEAGVAKLQSALADCKIEN